MTNTSGQSRCYSQPDVLQENATPRPNERQSNTWSNKVDLNDVRQIKRDPAEGPLVVAVLTLACIARAIVTIDLVRESVLAPDTDFGFFYFGLHSWLSGGAYTFLGRWPNSDVVLHDLAPPHWHLVILPIAAFSYSWAFVLWLAMNIGAFLISVWIITDELQVRWTPLKVAAFSAFVLFLPPTYAVIVLGQYAWLYLLPSTIAWRALRYGKWGVSYTVLGVLASVKPFPAVMLLYGLRRKKWGAIAAFIAAFVAVMTLGTLVFGITAYRDWLIALRSASVTTAWLPGNAAFAGFWERLLTETPAFIPVVAFPAVVPALKWISTLLVLALCIPLSRKPVDQAWIGLWMCGILASPIGWDHYFWWVLGPILALGQRQRWLHSPWPYVATFTMLLPTTGLGASTSLASVVSGCSTIVALGLVVAAMRRDPETPASYPGKQDGAGHAAGEMTGRSSLTAIHASADSTSMR